MYKHASGAKKRKAADEKKRKDEILLAKVPKLNAYFSASSNESIFSASASASASTATDDTEELLQPSAPSASSSPTSFSNDASCSNDAAFSKDAALWCKQENSNYCQAYWAKHGSFFQI